jgi:hypothetical protein
MIDSFSLPYLEKFLSLLILSYFIFSAAAAGGFGGVCIYSSSVM